MTIRITRPAGWLRIICAALLLSLGISHQPVSAQPASIATDAALVLPDGSYAPLCLGGTGTGEPEKSGWHGCDTCLIASGAWLPLPPAGDAPAPRAFVTIDFAVRAASHVLQAGRPGSPVRGPPFIIA